MTPEEKAEYTARGKCIEEPSETLGKGKGTKRTNDIKLKVIEEQVCIPISFFLFSTTASHERN